MAEDILTTATQEENTGSTPVDMQRIYTPVARKLMINIFGEMISNGNRDIAINDIMNLLIQNANFTDEELNSLSVMLGFEEN